MTSLIKLIISVIKTYIEEYIRTGYCKKFFNSILLEYKKIQYVYFDESRSVFINVREFIVYNVKKRYIRVKRILFRDQTTSLRFFFGWMCIGLATFFLFSTTLANNTSEYKIMIEKLPGWVWAIMYFIIGISLLYGVIEEKFNFFLLLTEGLLNVLTWWVSSYYILLAQGIPGAHFIGAVMATWLYVRYPTHKMKSDSYYRKRLGNLRTDVASSSVDVEIPGDDNDVSGGAG